LPWKALQQESRPAIKSRGALQLCEGRRTEDTGMKTLLIVDDVPGNVDVVLGFLAGAGYRVLVSDSGNRALDQLARNLPDLILLDLIMPGMDGIETCRRIKANKEWNHIPIIMMTAADELTMKLAAFTAGAVDFVTKPVQPEEVQARVQTHLQIRELQESLEQKNQQLAEEIELRLDAEKQLESSLEQALVIANQQGHVLFATGQARILLNTFFAERSDKHLPAELLNWLVGPDSKRPKLITHKKRGEIEVDHFAISKTGNLSLLRLDHRNGDNGPKALLSLGVTAREAEVLYWISEGKTNPEIAIIIDASLNTVKKHAINLFAKLGVETRTGAARLALGVLTPQQ
jgi:CheY-like chemotaxis protein/DNA-binding CsgD family transcriptional regulator